MSERGSFVTEYIYCDEALKVVKKYLLRSDKFLTGSIMDSWVAGETLPIIAGKIGALYAGGEICAMKDLMEEMAKELSTDVTIVVVCDNGDIGVVRSIGESNVYHA